ncbi:hypothetical protein FB446DRAFT_457828 [Lentinula raphanica]|nr:hypothetical protein FB446DRAFT_457828 [Lentinula raphanica]
MTLEFTLGNEANSAQSPRFYSNQETLTATDSVLFYTSQTVCKKVQERLVPHSTGSRSGSEGEISIYISKHSYLSESLARSLNYASQDCREKSRLRPGYCGPDSRYPSRASNNSVVQSSLSRLYLNTYIKLRASLEIRMYFFNGVLATFVLTVLSSFPVIQLRYIHLTRHSEHHSLPPSSENQLVSP